MHIYDYTDRDNPVLSDQDSYSAIKRDSNLYPSVTSINKYIPNDFINDIWLPQKTVELKENNPHMTWLDIRQHLWGFVSLPADENDPHTEVVPSSEFGTMAHEALENLIRRDIFMDKSAEVEERWENFVKPTFKQIKKLSLTPVYVEKLVCCHKMRVAGRIDLIARDEKTNKYVLLDYKFRKPAKTISPRDSDAAQLAIEAEMFANDEGLGYIPKICTVVVDNVSGKPKFIWYTDKKADWARRIFKITRDLVFMYKKL